MIRRLTRSSVVDGRVASRTAVWLLTSCGTCTRLSASCSQWSLLLFVCVKSVVSCLFLSYKFYRIISSVLNRLPAYLAAIFAKKNYIILAKKCKANVFLTKSGDLQKCFNQQDSICLMITTVRRTHLCK